MPRPSKGARLWLRPARRSSGQTVAKAVWIIIDSGKHIATGCFKGQTREAEKRLADYIATKYQPSRLVRDIDQIDIADALSVYLDDHGLAIADQPKLERAISRLNDYWGGKTLSQVTTAECRGYVTARGKTGGARADLETLRAAINHHAKEGLHHGVVHVVLPVKGQPRDRWLTRAEAAKLFMGLLAVPRNPNGASRSRQGSADFDRETAVAALGAVHSDRPLHRHESERDRIGLAVSRRRAFIRRPRPRHLLSACHRSPGNQQTAKRRRRCRRGCLRICGRWVRRGIVTTHFVEWHGAPVKSVKTGFAHGVAIAGLWGKVTPHTLRHTAATWLMQRGVPIWQAAGYLGMSAQTLERTYGHHHPDYMRGAAEAITTKQAANNSGQTKNVLLVKSLVEPEKPQLKRQKSQ